MENLIFYRMHEQICCGYIYTYLLIASKSHRGNWYLLLSLHISLAGWYHSLLEENLIFYKKHEQICCGYIFLLHQNPKGRPVTHPAVTTITFWRFSQITPLKSLTGVLRHSYIYRNICSWSIDSRHKWNILNTFADHISSTKVTR